MTPVLLLSDTSQSRPAGGSLRDAEIAEQLKVSARTVANVRQRSQERGVLECLMRQAQHHRKARKLDGRQEAHLVAITCSAPPQGRSRWSLVLLRDKLIELAVVEQIGLETIRSTLKKTRSSRG